MSVLIKGMIKPRNCAECDIDCGIDYKWLSEHPEYYDAVPTHCPIIEVPPHGRLIDADALIEDLERQCKKVFRIDAVSPDDYWITRNEAYNEALWKTWVESFGNYLKTRQTVIPADKDGET